jgi:hypothetical protein
MSDYNRTGGPAFPVPSGTGMDRGMDLRDWFAGQALVGLASSVHPGSTAVAIADACYQAADAMLRERAR